MRIAVLMASAGDRLGGLETIAGEFAEGLALRGHSVTLVTGAGPGAMHRHDPASPQHYRVITAPTWGQNSPPAQLIARLRGVHPSIVESRIFWWALMKGGEAKDALLRSDVISAHFEPEAVASSRETEVPVVYYYAGPMDPRRLARGRFSKVVAISRMVADYHARLEVAGLPPVDGVVLPGVRQELIAHGAGANVGSLEPEVIFTGRLDDPEEKGVLTLLRCWPEVVSAVPRARLTIIGSGAGLQELRRYVAQSSCRDSVTLPGSVQHADVHRRLTQSSLYAFPSRFETFGIAPLEAMSAGLPVVASDIPALRESLDDAAIFLPCDDVSAWSAEITRLLLDPKARKELAESGPARARQLTWARQTEEYETYLLEAVSGSGS